MRRNTDALVALTVASASFLLYVRTLAPDVVDGDGGEFQFAAWNFSFVHPTGYPLFLILGGLFQHLVPLGNPAYRLNLFTAVTAALAAGMLYLVSKEITNHRFAALIAAASFAVTPAFWFDASAAESYALNAFFVAWLVFGALRWQAEPSTRKFAAFCFVYGLALTHHRTIILWLPAYVAFFAIAAWQSRPTLSAFRFTPRFSRYAFSFFLCAAAFLLPLLLYLYVPLRAPASPYAVLSLAPDRTVALYDNSPTGFVNYILGRIFQYEIGWDALSLTRLASLPQLLFAQYGALGIALGTVGFIVMLGRKEWARSALMLVGFAATVVFSSVYHIGDILHYYIPAYLVWGLWLGVAVAWAFEKAAGIQTLRSRRVGLVAAHLLLIISVLAQIVVGFSAADRSRETLAREQWTRILAKAVPRNAILVSNDRDEMMPLWYIQYVENTRRDLLGLFPLVVPGPQYANIARLTDSLLDTQRPTFFIKPMQGLEVKYRLDATLAPLVRVLGRATDAPPQFASNAVIADRLRVVGYDAVREYGSLRVAVYWQPRAHLDQNYTTFVHLLDANGVKVGQGNDHLVGGEYYPTSLWDVGETLRDEQTIPLSGNLPPGTYRLIVGMYRQPDLEALGEPVELGAVELK